MKKRIQTLFLLLAFVAPNVQAQFQFHNPTTTSSLLNDVTCLSSTLCFAVGGAGNVLQYAGLSYKKRLLDFRLVGAEYR